ncbi:MAG: NADP-dependent malic enzyme [Spirochaetia bacterium]|nr:NADP-dependent malic enzyme [Spirochaetia bacterium]
MQITEKSVLEYHSRKKKGKLSVHPTKPCNTQYDLSLAYTPGVAVVCNKIAANEDDVYEYTAKGNLVAVVSNGTAVLGLGAIGPSAGKPVMEGKAVLFKRFADVDVFDIELNSKVPDDIIKCVSMMQPTFGGINLEDIKAPDCFYIEEKLEEILDIPVFHDDQHGTAIIATAGLMNALELQKKSASDIKVVIAGAGAAGIACANLILNIGVQRENIMLVDSVGVVYKGRTDRMNEYKERFACNTNARTIADAMKSADVFMGVAAKDLLSEDMVKSMNEKPIIFAMANPDPEIPYDVAKAVRSDLIMATGRSDFPNQVNNVLGFPFIFRGALDVRARKINNEMKVAAAHALANLAKEPVPEEVFHAYSDERFSFGPEYIIPKPFDPRVLLWEAPAVAWAASKSGVAKNPLKSEEELEEYRKSLMYITNKNFVFMDKIYQRAKSNPKRVVFTDGENERVIRGAYESFLKGFLKPILLGKASVIKEKITQIGIPEKVIENFRIIHPPEFEKFESYAKKYYEMRQRKGLTWARAKQRVLEQNIFAPLMVLNEDADAYISGIDQPYSDAVSPGLKICNMKGHALVAGVYIVIIQNDVFFFSDTSLTIEPNENQLYEIAVNSSRLVKEFGYTPKIAMLSFSNFGSTDHPQTLKIKRVVKRLNKEQPDLIVDGEMQADTAVVEEILQRNFPFSLLKEKANLLIFPELNSANIAYKLLQRLGGATVIGPILTDTDKAFNIMQRNAEANEITDLAAVTVVKAQNYV